MDLFITTALSILLLSLSFYVITQTIFLCQRHIEQLRLSRAEHKLLREKLTALLESQTRGSLDTKKSWEGFRKFEISRIADEGGGIHSFYLTPLDGITLPPFRPGQHVVVQLTLPDPVLYAGGLRKDKHTIKRCYSLSDSPNHSDYYRITIQRPRQASSSQESSRSLASRYLYEFSQVGDTLDLKCPSGSFGVDLQDTHPIVLIGKDIGITPLISIVNTLSESQIKRDVWLFYETQNRKSHIFKAHLDNLVRTHEALRLFVFYTHPHHDDREQNENYTEGEITLDKLKAILPHNQFEFFVSGHPEIIPRAKSMLQAWNVPNFRIRTESFGPQSPTPNTKAASSESTNSAIEVTFKHSGKTCYWTHGEGTLLELAEKNGIHIESGCRIGSCGSCLTVIREGEVQTITTPELQPQKGTCLACVSIPKTHATLDA